MNDILHFKLPLTPALNDPDLTLSARSIDLALNLRKGDHLFRSAPIEVGSFHGYAVTAQLSFGSSYNDAQNQLTLYGADLHGEDQRCDQQFTITLSVKMPVMAGDFSAEPLFTAFFHQQRPSIVTIAGPCGYKLPERSALISALAETIRQAYEALTQQALAAGIASVLALATGPQVAGSIKG